MRCCLPSREQPLLSTNESIERLQDTFEALDMRCRSVWYRCEEYKIKAKRAKIEDNRAECMAQLRMRHNLLNRHALFVRLRSRIEETLNAIEQAQVVTGVAMQMTASKRTIDDILKSVNIDEIDSLMNDLEDQHHQINDMGQALARETTIADFDEEAALLLLDDPIELPNVPNVPKIENKKILL